MRVPCYRADRAFAFPFRRVPGVVEPLGKAKDQNQTLRPVRLLPARTGKGRYLFERTRIATSLAEQGSTRVIDRDKGRGQKATRKRQSVCREHVGRERMVVDSRLGRQDGPSRIDEIPQENLRTHE